MRRSLRPERLSRSEVESGHARALGVAPRQEAVVRPQALGRPLSALRWYGAVPTHDSQRDGDRLPSRRCTVCLRDVDDQHALRRGPLGHLDADALGLGLYVEDRDGVVGGVGYEDRGAVGRDGEP